MKSLSQQQKSLNFRKNIGIALSSLLQCNSEASAENLTNNVTLLLNQSGEFIRSGVKKALLGGVKNGFLLKHGPNYSLSSRKCYYQIDTGSKKKRKVKTIKNAKKRTKKKAKKNPKKNAKKNPKTKKKAKKEQSLPMSRPVCNAMRLEDFEKCGKSADDGQYCKLHRRIQEVLKARIEVYKLELERELIKERLQKSFGGIIPTEIEMVEFENMLELMKRHFSLIFPTNKIESKCQLQKNFWLTWSLSRDLYQQRKCPTLHLLNNGSPCGEDPAFRSLHCSTHGQLKFYHADYYHFFDNYSHWMCLRDYKKEEISITELPLGIDAYLELFLRWEHCKIFQIVPDGDHTDYIASLLAIIKYALQDGVELPMQYDFYLKFAKDISYEPDKLENKVESNKDKYNSQKKYLKELEELRRQMFEARLDTFVPRSRIINKPTEYQMPEPDEENCGWKEDVTLQNCDTMPEVEYEIDDRTDSEMEN